MGCFREGGYDYPPEMQLLETVADTVLLHPSKGAVRVGQ
jgi:hypothetical protein